LFHLYTRAVARTVGGSGDFFRYWGGEALYNMYDKNPQTGSAIQPVGEARIILAAIAVIELSHRDRLADVAARQFLVRRGMGSVTNPDHEGYVRRPIPTAHILHIIPQSDDAFERLTECSKRAQAASALAINAAALVTHDRDFPRVHSSRIIS
jgi:hypothetical protein